MCVCVCGGGSLWPAAEPKRLKEHLVEAGTKLVLSFVPRCLNCVGSLRGRCRPKLVLGFSHPVNLTGSSQYEAIRVWGAHG